MYDSIGVSVSPPVQTVRIFYLLIKLLRFEAMLYTRQPQGIYVIPRLFSYPDSTIPSLLAQCILLIILPLTSATPSALVPYGFHFSSIFRYLRLGKISEASGPRVPSFLGYFFFTSTYARNPPLRVKFLSSRILLCTYTHLLIWRQFVLPAS